MADICGEILTRDLPSTKQEGYPLESDDRPLHSRSASAYNSIKEAPDNTNTAPEGSSRSCNKCVTVLCKSTPTNCVHGMTHQFPTTDDDT